MPAAEREALRQATTPLGAVEAENTALRARVEALERGLAVERKNREETVARNGINKAGNVWSLDQKVLAGASNAADVGNVVQATVVINGQAFVQNIVTDGSAPRAL